MVGWRGSMAFCTPEGGKWHPRQSRGCYFPPRVYKPMDPMGPLHSRKHLFCYTHGNINIPLLKVLLSSSNIITTEYSLFSKQMNKKQFLTVPSNPRVFRTQRWKSANTGNDQGDVQHAFLLHVTWLVLDQSNFTVCYRGITISDGIVCKCPLILRSTVMRLVFFHSLQPLFECFYFKLLFPPPWWKLVQIFTSCYKGHSTHWLWYVVYLPTQGIHIIAAYSIFTSASVIGMPFIIFFPSVYTHVLFLTADPSLPA